MNHLLHKSVFNLVALDLSETGSPFVLLAIQNGSKNVAV